MEIEIVSIGGELLHGSTINTNAAWLSRGLTRLGFTVARHTVIPDAPDEIEQALKEALIRSSFVISTGGLGPTIDDLTRESAARLFANPPQSLPNLVGSALGAHFAEKGRDLFLLPGVPREMEAMFDSGVLPLLKRQKPIRYARRCHFCQMNEMVIDSWLREQRALHPAVEFGIYPSMMGLSVECFGPDEGELIELCRRLEQKFPTQIFAEENVALALHAAFIRSGKTLALAESCTGGALAASLTSIPGASKFFLGSLVAYSDGWKQSFLQVTHLESCGAVSRETVTDMVDGIMRASGSDYAAAISGILGPSGATTEKPVGTVYIAIGKKGETPDVGKIHAPKDRVAGIEFTKGFALSALWRRLVHNEKTFL